MRKQKLKWDDWVPNVPIQEDSLGPWQIVDGNVLRPSPTEVYHIREYQAAGMPDDEIMDWKGMAW